MKQFCKKIKKLLEQAPHYKKDAEELLPILESDDWREHIDDDKLKRLREIGRFRKESHSFASGIARNPDEIAKNTKFYFGDLDLFDLQDNKWPTSWIYLLGSLDLELLYSQHNIKFPKIVTGNMDLSGIRSADLLKLPESIGGNLYLFGLTSIDGLRLPKEVGGYVCLPKYIQTLDVLRLQQQYPNLKITANTDTSGMRSLDRDTKVFKGNLKFRDIPQHKMPNDLLYLSGDLDMKSVVNASTDISCPREVAGTVDFGYLQSMNKIFLPDIIGGHLILTKLISLDKLSLPNKVGGYVCLPKKTDKQTRRKLKRKYPMLNIIFDVAASSHEINKRTKVYVGSLKYDRINSTDKQPKGLVHVTGDLTMSDVTGVSLPKTIGGNFTISAKEIIKKLSEYVGGNLHLNSLKTTNGVVFPKSVGGNVELKALSDIKGAVLPKRVEGILDLSKLELCKDTIFPHYVGGDVNLQSLKSIDGSVLPRFIGGNLLLNSITSIEDLDFSNLRIIGKVFFSRKLSSTDFIKIKQKYPHINFHKK